MRNNILVTGGTGKTGRRIVDCLQGAHITPRSATRQPNGEYSVRFRWQDPTSFEDAFRDIDAVYLVAPTDTFDSIGAMQPGLQAALKAGVTRFVLLSASSLDEGGPMMGQVHAWLRENAPEWVVLRPSWFMQNFSEGHHLSAIQDHSAIFTATQDGRIGFIDAADIARCAARFLTAPKVTNTDHILTGPEALSYDTVVEVFSRHLGTDIRHKRLTTQGIANRYTDLGFPDDYAKTLAAMDEKISTGAEARITDSVAETTGQIPTSFDEFVRQNRAVWQA